MSDEIQPGTALLWSLRFTITPGIAHGLMQIEARPGPHAAFARR